ncbi:MAG: hypothetical protein GY835_03180 [bacterium]|nr:hypothetical protein [bacterium]
MREFRIYVLFLILLAVRFVADWLRFPVDGYPPAGVKAVDVVEYLTFYSAVYLSFSWILRSRAKPALWANGLGLAATALYMFVHIFEFFLPASGRTAYYAPSEHFLLNVATGFAATGDIGLWQFLRLPLCGAFLYVAQRWTGLSVTTSVLRLAGVYTFFMLYVHPTVWAFTPQETAVDEARLFDAGVRNLLICAYVTAVLAFACRLGLERKDGPRGWRDLTSDLFYVVLMMPAPTFVTRYTATELWLVVVTSLVMRGRLRQLLPGSRHDRPVFAQLTAGHILLLAASILWIGVEAGHWLILVVLGGIAWETLTDRLVGGRLAERPARLAAVTATVGLSYWLFIS